MANELVGQGDYKFEYYPDWAVLPNNEKLGTVSAVATDSNNNVYVFQRKDPPVLVFDETGTFLNSWGNGVFVSPHGLYIENDIVYITDREGQVALRFTLDGKPLQIIGEHGVASDTGCEIPGELLSKAAGATAHRTDHILSRYDRCVSSLKGPRQKPHRFVAV